MVALDGVERCETDTGQWIGGGKHLDRALGTECDIGIDRDAEGGAATLGAAGSARIGETHLELDRVSTGGLGCREGVDGQTTFALGAGGLTTAVAVIEDALGEVAGRRDG